MTTKGPALAWGLFLSKYPGFFVARDSEFGRSYVRLQGSVCFGRAWRSLDWLTPPPFRYRLGSESA